MKKLFALLALPVILSGCASTPKNPEFEGICTNISTLYTQSYELREAGANKTQALVFMSEMTKDIEDEKTRNFVEAHAHSAVHTVYDNPKTKKKAWRKGIKEQCLDKPPTNLGI